MNLIDLNNSKTIFYFKYRKYNRRIIIYAIVSWKMYFKHTLLFSIEFVANALISKWVRILFLLINKKNWRATVWKKKLLSCYIYWMIMFRFHIIFEIVKCVVVTIVNNHIAFIAIFNTAFICFMIRPLFMDERKWKRKLWLSSFLSVHK